MASSRSSRPAPQCAPVWDAFWAGGGTGQLLIQRCGGCGRWVHPPTDRCPSCGGPVAATAVSGRGNVFTFTINRQPYNPDVEVPYVIAIVELVEQPGLRFTTNIVGCAPEDVWIGMPVEVTFEQAGDAWAPIFTPAKAE